MSNRFSLGAFALSLAAMAFVSAAHAQPVDREFRQWHFAGPDIYYNYGDVEVRNDLLVEGDALFQGNVDIRGDLEVGGDTTLEDLSVTNLTVSEDATVDGDTSLGGELTVAGETELQGLNVNGPASIPQLDTNELTFEDITLGGTTTVEILQITGGADIAEPFHVRARDEIRPGMVVAIDPERTSQLRVADQPYDPKVAGVLSGANGIRPGMTLSQTGTLADGERNVALSGRVWCLVDADASGAIVPGDLLTTSATPGHAMKATDVALRSGAIIGKAMSPLESGRGHVLVLVSLQ